jgi:hypothetical protein
VERRDESVRRAGARYQSTANGSKHHAARQRAWVERCKQKEMTHQGCATAGPVVTLSVMAEVAVMEPSDAPSLPITPTGTDHEPIRERCSPARRCDFCHAPLPLFTRVRTWRGWGFG